MVRSGLIVAVMVAAVAPAGAQESAANISGPWKGTGFVQRDETSDPVNVRCEIEGNETADVIGFEGQCRAMLVVKRPIGADLTRSGDRLTGTYTGSALGVSQLDGTVAPDGSLTFTMTFPREVNGDNKAVMTIERPDDRTMRIRTVDRMLSGEEVTTSDITFTREVAAAN